MESCSFCAFLVFSPGRNAIFTVFWFSLQGEMQFSPFSAFLSGEKCNFHRFLVFSPGRNAIFTIFWFSLRGEMQFSPFSAFLSGEKRGFHRFLLFGAPRNTIFAWDVSFSAIVFVLNFILTIYSFRINAIP